MGLDLYFRRDLQHCDLFYGILDHQRLPLYVCPRFKTLSRGVKLIVRRAKFLTTKERDEVERRLAEDHGPLSNNFGYKYVLQAIKDWKIYIHMLICMAGFCPIYSFSLFLPTIIKNMGYSANQAQLMSVPPYVVACFFTIIASWVADRVKQRGIFMLGFQLVAILGFALLVGTSTPHIQYIGTVFAAIGNLLEIAKYASSNNPARYLSPDPARPCMEWEQYWRKS